MSWNCYYRVAQFKCKMPWKAMHLNGLSRLTMNINSQLINSLLKDSLYFFSTRPIFWNKILPFKALNALQNSLSPNCCLLTSNRTLPNWIHSFLLTSKLSIVMPSICFSFFEALQVLILFRMEGAKRDLLPVFPLYNFYKRRS